MSKMRVLHVVPNFGNGGAERIATYLLLNHDQSRFEVAAVSLFGRQGTELEFMLDKSAIRAWYLNKHKGFDPTMYKRLRTVFQEFDPDVVHTHRYVLRYLLHLFITQRQRVWFHTVHNLAEKEVDMIGKCIHLAVFKMGVVPIAIAKEVAISLERVYGIKNPIIIPNGIPVEKYSLGNIDREAWRIKEGFKTEEILFVSVARLTPQKDHQTLIKAFSIAASHNKRLRLLLVGDGMLRGQLKSLVRDLSLEDKVFFLGIRSDIPEVLNAADVSIFSSRWEGNPLAVMEAMAAGKPVIATAVGGIPEIVIDGLTGILVSPGDIIGLANKILWLAANETIKVQMGKAAKNIALERFDIDKITRRYELLYMNVFENGRCG